MVEPLQTERGEAFRDRYGDRGRTKRSRRRLTARLNAPLAAQKRHHDDWGSAIYNPERKTNTTEALTWRWKPRHHPSTV
jgi:hypothetical protein